MTKICVSVIAILSVAVLFVPADSYSQNLSFTAGGGISSFTGEGSEYWNMGFHLAGQGFFALTPNILVGGRVAYNRVTPDQGEYAREFDYPGLDVTVTGSGSIIELLPTVRLHTPVSPDQKISVFGQAGLGMYFATLTADMRISYAGTSWEESVSESGNDFGMCFGGGIGFAASDNLRLELLPLYHIIFSEEESTKYFSIGISVVLQ